VRLTWVCAPDRARGCHLAKRTPHQAGRQPFTVAPYAGFIVLGAAVVLMGRLHRSTHCGAAAPPAIAKPATPPGDHQVGKAERQHLVRARPHLQPLVSGSFDREFVAFWSNGPLLVRDDTTGQSRSLFQ
jgi:hypothetical protein